jgi:hypothetical protein
MIGIRSLRFAARSRFFSSSAHNFDAGATLRTKRPNNDRTFFTKLTSVRNAPSFNPRIVKITSHKQTLTGVLPEAFGMRRQTRESAAPSTGAAGL